MNLHEKINLKETGFWLCDDCKKPIYGYYNAGGTVTALDGINRWVCKKCFKDFRVKSLVEIKAHNAALEASKEKQLTLF